MHTVFARLRVMPALATVAGVALFVHLGLWQAGKADVVERERQHHEQQSHQARLEVGAALASAEGLRDRPVVVRGQYEAADRFFVDNRQEGGRPGVHVVTPLRIEGSQTRILVNRGWIGWGANRQQLPEVATPSGTVEVRGLASVPSDKKFFLMPDRPEPIPRLWSRLDLERFATEARHPVQPIVILQDAGDAQDGLVRHWPPPEDRSVKHRGYAFQWFAMAAGLVVFFGFASLRRRSHPVTDQ